MEASKFSHDGLQEESLADSEELSAQRIEQSAALLEMQDEDARMDDESDLFIPDETLRRFIVEENIDYGTVLAGTYREAYDRWLHGKGKGSAERRPDAHASQSRPSSKPPHDSELQASSTKADFDQIRRRFPTGRVGGGADKDSVKVRRLPERLLRGGETPLELYITSGLPTAMDDMIPQAARVDEDEDDDTDPPTERVPDAPQQPLHDHQTLPEFASPSSADLSSAPDHPLPSRTEGNDDQRVQPGHVYEAASYAARSLQVAVPDSHEDSKEPAGSSTSVVGKAGDTTTSHVAELASENDSGDERRLLRSPIHSRRPERETRRSRMLEKYALWQDESDTDDVEARSLQQQSHDQTLAGEDTTHGGPSQFKQDDGRVKMGTDLGLSSSSSAAQMLAVEPSSAESNVDGVGLNEREGPSQQRRFTHQELLELQESPYGYSDPADELEGQRRSSVGSGTGPMIRIPVRPDRAEPPTRVREQREEDTAKVYIVPQVTLPASSSPASSSKAHDLLANVESGAGAIEFFPALHDQESERFRNSQGRNTADAHNMPQVSEQAGGQTHTTAGPPVEETISADHQSIARDKGPQNFTPSPEETDESTQSLQLLKLLMQAPQEKLHSSAAKGHDDGAAAQSSHDQHHANAIASQELTLDCVHEFRQELKSLLSGSARLPELMRLTERMAKKARHGRDAVPETTALLHALMEPVTEKQRIALFKDLSRHLRAAQNLSYKGNYDTSRLRIALEAIRSWEKPRTELKTTKKRKKIPIAGLKADDVSDYDDAESVFSQESIVSKTTSLGDGLGYSNNLISNLISDLLCNKEMVPINLTAIKEPSIGSERYHRNVRRLIKTFGKNLKAEAKGSLQMGAARALQTRRISTHAARELATRSEALLDDTEDVSRNQLGKSSSENHKDEHEPGDHDAGSDASVDSADEDEDAEQPTDENLTRIRDFLLASNAYASLKDRLLEFAHQPYLMRIRKAVGTDAIGEAGKVLHLHDIEDAVEELSWVPVTTPGLCQCRETFRLSLLDRVQGFLEDHLDTKWDWWPMGPRVYLLREGFCRLQWRSPCGTPHHLDIPESAKEPLQAAFRTAPAFLDPAPAPSANFIDHVNAKIQPSLSSTTGFRLYLDHFMSRWTVPKIVYSSVALSSSLQKVHSLPWPAPVAVGAHPATPGPSTAAALHSPRSTGSPQRPARYSFQAAESLIPAVKPQYLHLCIERGDFRFETIQCDELRDDIDFFRKLKSTYDLTRGPLRRWFSTWQYDHCKFYEFEKVGNQLALPICEGFPEDGDAMYEFEPRPPLHLPPNGPVSARLFNLRYYLDNQLPWWRRWTVSKGNYMPFSQGNDDVLRSLPKRKEFLEMGGHKLDHFFGLLATESICHRRRASYVVFGNLFGIIFLFVWIFGWDHPLDLQSAAVPVTLSVMLTALCFQLTG